MPDPQPITDLDLLELSLRNPTVSACLAIARARRLDPDQTLRLLVCALAEALERTQVAWADDMAHRVPVVLLPRRPGA